MCKNTCTCVYVLKFNKINNLTYNVKDEKFKNENVKFPISSVVILKIENEISLYAFQGRGMGTDT